MGRREHRARLPRLDVRRSGADGALFADRAPLPGAAVRRRGVAGALAEEPDARRRRVARRLPALLLPVDARLPGAAGELHGGRAHVAAAAGAAAPGAALPHVRLVPSERCARTAAAAARREFPR